MGFFSSSKDENESAVATITKKDLNKDIDQENHEEKKKRFFIFSRRGDSEHFSDGAELIEEKNQDDNDINRSRSQEILQNSQKARAKPHLAHTSSLDDNTTVLSAPSDARPSYSVVSDMYSDAAAQNDYANYHTHKTNKKVEQGRFRRTDSSSVVSFNSDDPYGSKQNRPSATNQSLASQDSGLWNVRRQKGPRSIRLKEIRFRTKLVKILCFEAQNHFHV